MRILKSLFLLIPVFVVASMTEVAAQKKTQRTSGAMAAYGVAPAQGKYKRAKVKKVKKSVPKKAPKAKEPKSARTKRSAPSYRKKNNWAS